MTINYQGDDSEESRLAEVSQNLIKLLDKEGHNYDATSLPEIFKPEQSGTADLHLVKWGPKASQVTRVVKTNKPAEKLTSPRQRRHVIERGYDTRNELQIATSIDHPGIVKVVDYFDSETSKQYGFVGPVLIQEYFPESESLEEIVLNKKEPEKKKLSLRTVYDSVVSTGESVIRSILGRNKRDSIYDIALQTAGTLRDIHNGEGVKDNRAIVHRDLKPSNILVQNKNGKIVAKLIDCGNAAPIDSQKSGYLPTMGGHIVSDPLCMGVFSGEERKYGFDSDIYGLFSSILYLSKGKPAVEYDPDRGEARAIDSWESLLNHNGKLDKEKHQRVVRKASKALVKPLRRIAERALSLYENQRYKSTDEFYNDLEKAVQTSDTTTRLRKLGLAAILAVSVTAAGIGLYAHGQSKAKLEKTVATQLADKETEKKLRVINLYLQSRDLGKDFSKINENERYNQSYSDFMDEGELNGWLDKFYPYNYNKNIHEGDQKTAFAAYLDPDATYEAIAECRGKTDWGTIGEYLMQHNPNLWCETNTINVKSIDNIAGIIRRDRQESIKTRWAQAEENYKTKKTAEQKEKERLQEFYEKERNYQEQLQQIHK